MPKGLRSAVVDLCHSHPMAGHFGPERTYKRFVEKYFWPGAQKKVEDIVHSCHDCNAYNPPRTTYVKAPLQQWKPMIVLSWFVTIWQDHFFPPKSGLIVMF